MTALGRISDIKSIIGLRRVGKFAVLLIFWTSWNQAVVKKPKFKGADDILRAELAKNNKTEEIETITT